MWKKISFVCVENYVYLFFQMGFIAKDMCNKSQI